MAFLELNSVGKSFRTSTGTTEVLRDINLSVDEGEFVAVVGYSGSGKTTLINLVAGLVFPDTGSVMLSGKQITGPGPDRGIVFQNYSLLPWLTVTQNIALAVDNHFTDWSAERRHEHVEKQIAMVGLAHAAKKLPRELSGGMRQRVSLARGLTLDPRMLLLDEPLGALDALTRGSLQEEIVRIWEADRKTVLMITNDVDEALLMADRIVPLTAGPGASLGESILVNLARPRRRKELNHDPEFKRLRTLVTKRLTEIGAKRSVSVSARVSLPDLLPEDLTHGRPFFAGKLPRRRPAAQVNTSISIPG